MTPFERIIGLFGALTTIAAFALSLFGALPAGEGWRGSASTNDLTIVLVMFVLLANYGMASICVELHSRSKSATMPYLIMAAMFCYTYWKLVEILFPERYTNLYEPGRDGFLLFSIFLLPMFSGAMFAVVTRESKETQNYSIVHSLTLGFGLLVFAATAQR